MLRSIFESSSSSISLLLFNFEGQLQSFSAPGAFPYLPLVSSTLRHLALKAYPFPDILLPELKAFESLISLTYDITYTGEESRAQSEALAEALPLSLTRLIVIVTSRVRLSGLKASVKPIISNTRFVNLKLLEMVHPAGDWGEAFLAVAKDVLGPTCAARGIEFGDMRKEVLDGLRGDWVSLELSVRRLPSVSR